MLSSKSSYTKTSNYNYYMCIYSGDQVTLALYRSILWLSINFNGLVCIHYDYRIYPHASAVQYYWYHNSIDTGFGIAKESLGIASTGYI